jgi:hypothetical protein
VTYIVRGEYDGEGYALTDYTASIPTRFRGLLERGLGLRSEMTGETLGTGGPLLGNDFIDENCYVNLYAYQEEGFYADLDQHADGSMTALLYDYETLDSNGLPTMIEIELPPCVPERERVTPPELGEPEILTCTVGDACILTLEGVPPDFTILSPLYVNPLTLEVDIAVGSGTYAGAAVWYENGEEKTKPFIIELV